MDTLEKYNYENLPFYDLDHFQYVKLSATINIMSTSKVFYLFLFAIKDFLFLILNFYFLHLFPYNINSFNNSKMTRI